MESSYYTTISKHRQRFKVETSITFFVCLGRKCAETNYGRYKKRFKQKSCVQNNFEQFLLFFIRAIPWKNVNVQYLHIKIFTQENIWRLKKICRSELSLKHKIANINQMALPVLIYGFGIIDWPEIEIDNLNVKTRKILTLHNVLYRHQCMDRVYLPRREEGFGLIEINYALGNTIINLAQYVETTKDFEIYFF